MEWNQRCPACGEQADLEVLRESHDLLLRCPACGHVHRAPREAPPEPLRVRAIVSAGTQSRPGTIELMPDDLVEVGNLLVAEGEGDEAVGVEVSSIEVKGGGRVPRARAEEVVTLWTRVIEDVVVPVSVHRGRETRPFHQRVDGEQVFVVGEVYTFGGRRVRISHIKLRDGPVLRKEGWKTVARRIRRIYGRFERDETSFSGRR
ncbi:MAG TPA: HVO_0476 family zinc finger protein [Methanoregulaceae archaeon]|nr:HVO_0476 family zinc finger protein [Methanoregulaceae archaeon]HQJ88063.1 HVO_0476 family zinc finger protein [Methanoregulaceae archaeon]